MNDIEPISQGAPSPALNASGITPAFATPGTVQLAEWAAELDYAHKLGTAMAHSNFLPQSLLLGKNKQPKPLSELANDAAVVILAGKSVGLDPLQSVQNIFPVHGQPSMYARTMGALVVAQGHETKRTEATDKSVTWSVKRAGDKDWQDFTWTIQRAQLAGYTSNKKYQSDPIAMLGAKALAEACRTVFPDVLLGMAYSVEDMELEDMGETPSVPAPVKTQTITRKPRATPAVAPAPEPVQEPQVPMNTGHPDDDRGTEPAPENVDTVSGEITEPPAPAADEPMDYLKECEARLGNKDALKDLYKLAKRGGASDEVMDIIIEAGKDAAAQNAA